MTHNRPGSGATLHGNLSSDNSDHCLPICFNYDELDLICRFLENQIDCIDTRYDENIEIMAEAKLILSSLEYFRDLFE